MPAAREHVGGTVLDGRLYVLGGRDARTDALGTATRFDPASGKWEALPPLRVAAERLEAVNEDGAGPALGGGDDRGGTATGAVQRFDPSEDRWRVVSRMRTPRHGFRRVRRRPAHLHLRPARRARCSPPRSSRSPSTRARPDAARPRSAPRDPDPEPVGAGLARRRRRPRAGGRRARADPSSTTAPATAPRSGWPALGDPRLRVLRHDRPMASPAPATTGSRPPPGAGPRSWTTTTTRRRASCAEQVDAAEAAGAALAYSAAVVAGRRPRAGRPGPGAAGRGARAGPDAPQLDPPAAART